jgi:tetratricopeptide (TPR) repeat protein
MNLTKKIALILIQCLLFFSAYSQSEVVDSLLKCSLSQKNEDSLTSTYIELCWEYSYYGKNNEAISCGLKAIEFAKKNKNEFNLAAAQNALGSAYDEISNFKKAEYYFNEALKFYKSKKKDKKISATLNNLGTVYFSESNYKKALECFYEALKLKEQLKDSSGIANCYTNLANVYWEIDQKQKAIDLFNKSIVIHRVINNKEGLGSSLSNLAGLYSFLGEFEKAYKCHSEALKIYQEINLPEGLSSCYSNMGFYFRELKKIDSAVYYYQKAIDISITIGDQVTYANSLLSLGEIKAENKKPKEAILYYKQALKLLDNAQSLNSMQSVYLALSNAYFDVGDYKNAIIMHRNYSFLKDSLFSVENSKIFSDLKTQFEVDKKETEISAKAEAEKEKLKEISEIDKQKRNSVIIAVIIILLLLLIFSTLLFKRFKLIQKQNKIIEFQKTEVEHQKQLIEEHQKEMNDSISYAKRIQSSFMASENEFKGKLKDYFILFNPKDVVSGDFYWAGSTSNHLYFCVADSTGHGIPGAFMSLLNISLLNEALLSKGLTETNELLDFVRKILIIGLKADESGQGGNDGMDCTMVRLDINRMEIQVSGANNPLWILRDNKLIEIPVDKMPVGRSPKENIPFKSTTFQLQVNDLVIMFTDGYADQFGGPKGKKFKYKQLNELLIEISDKPLKEQSIRLQEIFSNWKGDLEQVDDVCIIGFKL